MAVSFTEKKETWSWYNINLVCKYTHFSHIDLVLDSLYETSR